MTDVELLREYVTKRSEEAFTSLVRRHLNLVYSSALRQVRSPHLAEEVAQSVFTDLSRTAPRLRPGTVLAAWLYQVTCRTAVDVIRSESRRHERERIVAAMVGQQQTTIFTRDAGFGGPAAGTCEASGVMMPVCSLRFVRPGPVLRAC